MFFSAGAQHIFQNNKQPSSGLYGANVQNHLRNVNTITNPSQIPAQLPAQIPAQIPAQLPAQNPQPHGQDMCVSPLTSDMMASITQRANQLHQQNLYKAPPMQQIHHQQQV